jgi:hypothetical protein
MNKNKRADSRQFIFSVMLTSGRLNFENCNADNSPKIPTPEMIRKASNNTNAFSSTPNIALSALP